MFLMLCFYKANIFFPLRLSIVFIEYFIVVLRAELEFIFLFIIPK